MVRVLTNNPLPVGKGNGGLQSCVLVRTALLFVTFCRTFKTRREVQKLFLISLSVILYVRFRSTVTRPVSGVSGPTTRVKYACIVVTGHCQYTLCDRELQLAGPGDGLEPVVEEREGRRKEMHVHGLTLRTGYSAVASARPYGFRPPHLNT